MPFYIGDWKKAPEIKILPLDTRAVWLEMLFIMWECEDRGYLKINGHAPTNQDLAIMIGGGLTAGDIKKHLDLLEKYSVFSRNSDGFIYSRKMVKIQDIRSKRMRAGKLGGKQISIKDIASELPNAENETEKSLVLQYNKTIDDFIDMRRHIKKPLTERAAKLLASKLNDLAGQNNDPAKRVRTKIKILEQSIFHNWQGVFPLKNDLNNDDGYH